MSAEVAFKAEGFNRTVQLEGFCSDSKFVSSSFDCAGGGGEFYAKLVAPFGALTLGAGRCPFSGITAYKTPKGPFPAEIRFQFDNCVGAPVTSAAVVAGLRKDPSPSADSKLAKFAKQVCKQATTTLPPSVGAGVATISAQTKTTVVQIGAGTCDAAIHKEIKGILTQADCKAQCIGSASKATILKQAGCDGFAFNPAVSREEVNCRLFTGNVSKAKAEDHWSCFNMSQAQNVFSKSTPPPPVIKAETDVELAIHQAFGNMGEAYMQQISPPADAATCFSPMWYFTLQDRAGKGISMSVNEAVWDQFLAFLPVPAETTVNVSAPQVLDRVMVDFCGTGNGWGHTTCYVPPVEKSNCRNLEVTSALVAGIFTSLGTWALVGGVYILLLRNRKTAQYEALVDADRPKSACPMNTLIALSLVALGGALLCAWLVITFLNHAFRNNTCFNYDEFLVVILAVMLAVALAIVGILLYMARAHPAHPHPLFQQPGPPKAASKYVLVEVEEGSKVAHPVAPDVMSSTGHVFASYMSHSPNSSGISQGPTDTKTLAVR